MQTHYEPNGSRAAVVPLFLAQSGDIINQDGSGGESIYGETFEDENFTISHEKEGMLGMANNGKNSNNSQFYITTVPCTHLDGINVVFGRVRKGLNIIVEMADMPRIGDKPIDDIRIENCGQFKLNEPWNIGELDGTDDIYPPWPNDWDIIIDDENNFPIIEDAINRIKDSGNFYFKQNNLIDSERKYKKTLRYIDWFIGINNNYKKDNIEELKSSSLLNLAAVRLKNEKYKDVINLCSQVINRDDKNGKAYYRRAQARLALKDYDKALNDLNDALNIHPNDKNVRHILNMTKKSKLTYLKKEKRLFGKLFK